MARPKRQGPRRREAVAVLSGEMLMTLLHGRGFFEALDPELVEDARDEHGKWIAEALEASGIEADDEGLYSWGSDAYSVAAAEARRRGVLDTSDCY